MQLVAGNRAETDESLRSYDIALMGRPPSDFAAESEPLRTSSLRYDCLSRVSAGANERVPEDQLANPRFLVREEGSGTRDIFEYFLNAQMIQPPKVTVEMGSNETTKQAVMAGLGLSLISAHTIASEVAAMRLAILKLEGGLKCAALTAIYRRQPAHCGRSSRKKDTPSFRNASRCNDRSAQFRQDARIRVLQA